MARLPAIFLGHGSPMYALEPNKYTEVWSQLSARLPTQPSAILAISAHWVTRGIWLTAMENPPTIHDFRGFPEDLFQIQYPVPGSIALAERVRDLLFSTTQHITLEESEWGLDHGTWSVLKYMFPQADIPVVQMSLDATLSEQDHLDLAEKLIPLRDEGILIISSGNVVHNLEQITWGNHALPAPWAIEFNNFFKAQLRLETLDSLVHWKDADHGARLSIPTPEHYWPAIYTLGLKQNYEKITLITDGIEMSSISMLSFAVGQLN